MLKRHYYMKTISIFIAELGNPKAILAVSALVRAMKEMNKVAILHCVWRQGQGNVVIGVLTRNVSKKDSVVSLSLQFHCTLYLQLSMCLTFELTFLFIFAGYPDSFYFNVLHFAEDVREFKFPSFSNFSSWQPNEQQQEAADNLVKMFDFVPAGKEEVLPPVFTPNPVLEHMSKTLGYCDSVLQLNLVQGYCPCQLNNVELNYEPCKTRNAKGLVAPAIVAGLGALTHTLGTLVPVIEASGFATAAVATAIGTVVGSF